MLSDNNNNIDMTLYESYLSFAILEFKDLYSHLFLKIANVLDHIVNKNANNVIFQRKLFASFSVINEDFPGYTSMSDFLSPNFDVYAAATLHKIFFTFLTKDFLLPPFKTTEMKSLVDQVSCYIINNKNLLSSLVDSLSPDHIFSDHQSGRKEKNIEEYPTTAKFGITTQSHATPFLLDFFSKSYIPGQFKYKKNLKSQAVAWLEKNNLPFVSGISGTIGTCYCGLITLSILSKEEMKTYLMVLSATLVARGHHSFGEIHPVLKKIGYKMDEIHDKRSYYEQFLTKEFQESPNYKQFLIKIQNLTETHQVNMKPL